MRGVFQSLILIVMGFCVLYWFPSSLLDVANKESEKIDKRLQSSDCKRVTIGNGLISDEYVLYACKLK